MDGLVETVAQILAEHRRAGFDSWVCRCGGRIQGTSPKAERTHIAEMIVERLGIEPEPWTTGPPPLFRVRACEQEPAP